MSDRRYRPEEFQVDGSLRDVCVLDAGVQEWQNALLALAETDWETALELTPPEGTNNPSAAAIFDRLQSDPDASARLAVRVGSVWFTSYFFDPSEIEFTFDPADIRSAAEFRSVEDFMTWLAKVSRRRVVLTMESSTEHRTLPALLEITP